MALAWEEPDQRAGCDVCGLTTHCNACGTSADEVELHLRVEVRGSPVRRLMSPDLATRACEHGEVLKERIGTHGTSV